MKLKHPLSSPAAIAVPALAIAAVLALASAALAHTYTPTRFDDPAPNGCKPHNCSLREAIIEANHQPGGDKVVLAGGKTYNLSIPPNLMDDETNGDLNLTDSVKLTSSNQKLATIDAGNMDDVIHSGEVDGVHASLTRLRLRHGNGAIELIGGSLVLSRSVLSRNTSTVFGGGIDALKGSSLTVSRSRVSGNHASVNAGGIATNGTAVISRSTISGNSAGSAAGGLLIEDQSPGVTVRNSVISGNHAKDQGGGIVVDSRRLKLLESKVLDNTASDSEGGGIAATGPLEIVRSVIAGNAAIGGGGVSVHNHATIAKSTIANNRGNAGVGGGIYDAPDGTLKLTSSTLFGNTTNNDGGAVQIYGKATLINDTVTKNHAIGYGGGVEVDASNLTVLNGVTIARNTAGTGGGIEGTPLKVSNSLIALNSSSGLGPDCHPGPTIVSAGHNLIGDTTDCGTVFGGPTHDFTNLNPKIAQLADNGGRTKTIALRRHSKAINHAGSTAPKRDQRGVKRDSKPDIGAYERP
jgi:hypothetical protein